MREIVTLSKAQTLRSDVTRHRQKGNVMVPADYLCHFCGENLLRGHHYRYRGVCERFECQKNHIHSESQKLRASDAQRYEHRRNVARKFVQHEETIDLDRPQECITVDPRVGEKQLVDPLAVHPVPALERELTVLPEERKRLFQAHLSQAVREAFSEPVPCSNSESENRDSHPTRAEPLPILSFACGTCRGDCCRQGGTHAFVSKDLITRIRQIDPSSSPDEIIHFYTSRLTERTYDESCVFHQQFGCGLPRDRRANICNSFECDDLCTIKRQYENGPAWTVSMAGDQVVRARRFAADSSNTSICADPSADNSAS